MPTPHWPTFSLLGSCACAKSSGQFCGNCLPISPTTARVLKHFFARCRGQPRRRLPSRDSTTRRWPGGRGQSAECEYPLRHALEVRHPSFENRDFITPFARTRHCAWSWQIRPASGHFSRIRPATLFTCVCMETQSCTSAVIRPLRCRAGREKFALGPPAALLLAPAGCAAAGTPIRRA